MAARLLVFCSLLARALCVIAPSLPDVKAMEKRPVAYWHESVESFTEADVEVQSTSPGAPQPRFLESDPGARNLTAQLGSRVYLHCRVEQLGEKTISWIRRRGDDLHLLSVGRHSYSADSRYSLAYEKPDNWRLLIQYVSERDEGFYECQISSHPPLVKRIYLSVVVPRVEIVDERGVPIQDKFYKEGSIIELRCEVSKLPAAVRQVIWKHGGRLLNYDTKRGGVSVKTESRTHGALSRLYIANANRQDSGNYSCALADVAVNTVAVHVLRGENPLAMQRGQANQVSLSSILFLAALLIS